MVPTKIFSVESSWKILYERTRLEQFIERVCVSLEI